MYAIDVIQAIESININFETAKRIIFEIQDIKLKEQLVNRVRKVEKDLHKLNVVTAKVVETSDKAFLNEQKVDSHFSSSGVAKVEVYLSEISVLIEQLEASFKEVYNIYLNTTELHDNGFDLILSIHKEIISITHAFSDIDEKYSDYSNLRKKIEYDSINFIRKELDSKLSEHEKSSAKMFKSFEGKMNDIEVTAEKEFYDLNIKIKEIREIYNRTLNELQGKHEQMDEMLGQSANRVMAQDYDSSAVAEKAAANWLRGGSLACMTIIVLIVCYSFYDSTHSGFDWESSIFRTALVFILSIPAAYLSRESAKHREQQYNYHHTALDLKAITPYIASLPETDQNRIKVSIAERIFASRQTNVAQQESFPLNTQDLIIEIIKKVDLNRKTEQQYKDEKGS